MWWINSKLVYSLIEFPFYPFIIEGHIGLQTRLFWQTTSLAQWHNPCEEPATLLRPTAVTLTEDKKISNSWFVCVLIAQSTQRLSLRCRIVYNTAFGFWVLIIVLPFLDSWCYSANKAISSLINLCFQGTTNRSLPDAFQENPHLSIICTWLIPFSKLFMINNLKCCTRHRSENLTNLIP